MRNRVGNRVEKRVRVRVRVRVRAGARAGARPRSVGCAPYISRSASSLPPAPLKAARKPSSRMEAFGLGLGLALGLSVGLGLGVGVGPCLAVGSSSGVAAAAGASCARGSRGRVSGSSVFTRMKSSRKRAAARKHGARLVRGWGQG